MIMNFMNHQIPKLQSHDVYRDDSMYDNDYNNIIIMIEIWLLCVDNNFGIIQNAFSIEALSINCT